MNTPLPKTLELHRVLPAVELAIIAVVMGAEEGTSGAMIVGDLEKFSIPKRSAARLNVIIAAGEV